MWSPFKIDTSSTVQNTTYSGKRSFFNFFYGFWQSNREVFAFEERMGSNFLYIAWFFEHNFYKVAIATERNARNLGNGQGIVRGRYGDTTKIPIVVCDCIFCS
jgi:hypothetical protein